MGGARPSLYRRLVVAQHRTLLITCDEPPITPPANWIIVLISLEHLENISQALKVADADRVIVDLHRAFTDIQTRYGYIVASRITRRIVIELYSFSKGTGTAVSVLLPSTVFHRAPIGFPAGVTVELIEEDHPGGLNRPGYP